MVRALWHDGAMPNTAKKHFNEDIARATALLDHASGMALTTASDLLARDDILRSAWMFAVGAMDAYFSDAYGDIVAAILIAKNREARVTLPSSVLSIDMPVAVVLSPYKARQNWRWRVGARRMMDRENVLSTAKIQSLFNKFFRDGHHFYGDVVDTWFMSSGSTKRVLGTTPANYLAMNAQNKDAARKKAKKRIVYRFDKSIAQRRHDCIHNCDRPKVKPQPIDSKSVREVIADVSFFVGRCDAHIATEFGLWMRTDVGFADATVTGVGY